MLHYIQLMKTSFVVKAINEPPIWNCCWWINLFWWKNLSIRNYPTWSCCIANKGRAKLPLWHCWLVGKAEQEDVFMAHYSVFANSMMKQVMLLRNGCKIWNWQLHHYGSGFSHFYNIISCTLNGMFSSA